MSGAPLAQPSLRPGLDTPRVLVGASAWRAIEAELSRVAPDEGVLVPLISVVPWDGQRLPGEPWRLRELAYVCVPEVLTLPPELQRNHRFLVRALASADVEIGRLARRRLARHRRLRPAAFIHSHPFAVGGTWPSGGDIEGHLRPLLEQNRAAALEASFSFIAYRLRDGGWGLGCYALDDGGAVIDLGEARVVPDGAPSMRAALGRESHAARQLAVDWARQARAAGLDASWQRLFDGWLRLCLGPSHAEVGEATARTVTFIPDDFPARPAHSFVIVDEVVRAVPSRLAALFAELVPRRALSAVSGTPQLAPTALDTLREDYFARVVPVLGAGLARCRVGITAATLGDIAALLVGCRLGELHVPRGLDLPDCVRWARDLGVTTVVEHDSRSALIAASEVCVEHVPLQRGAPHVRWSTGRALEVCCAAADPAARRELAHHAARLVRDRLLGAAPTVGRPSFVGGAAWPWGVSNESPALSPPAAVDLRGRRVLVVGVGSVGSEVSRQLGAAGVELGLVDGGQVSVFNLARQWFGPDDVGRNKAVALAERLRGARAFPENLGATDGARLADLVAATEPEVVLLATGTAEQLPLAKVLWDLGVPHVVACAYARARFFEVVSVAPAAATPCLSCLRGHLWAGPAPGPSVSDELASFIYAEVDDHDRRYTDLVAEPATRLETRRIADVAGRCIGALLAAPPDRPAWLARMFAEGTTCLLGANDPERRGESWAYGLSAAGQVIRLGLPDVVDAATERVCADCGRAVAVEHQVLFQDEDFRDPLPEDPDRIQTDPA